MHDLQLRAWKAVRLDDSTSPVRLSLDVETSDGHQLRWVIELLPGTDPMWRLVGSSDPRRAARG